jgi:hypothetical protein
LLVIVVVSVGSILRRVHFMKERGSRGVVSAKCDDRERKGERRRERVEKILFVEGAALNFVQD